MPSRLTCLRLRGKELLHFLPQIPNSDRDIEGHEGCGHFQKRPHRDTGVDTTANLASPDKSGDVETCLDDSVYLRHDNVLEGEVFNHGGLLWLSKQ